MKRTHIDQVPSDARPEVVEFLVGYGMSFAEVAEAIGRTRSQVRYEVQQLGGRDLIADEVPRGPGDLYEAAFVRCMRDELVSDVIRTYAIPIIRVWLGLDQVYMMIADWEEEFAAMGWLSEDDSDAAKIWNFCFERVPFPWQSADDIMSLLREMAAGKPPRSIDEMRSSVRSLVRRRILSVIREGAAPALSEVDRTEIMGYFAALSERERQVLGMRLGLADQDGNLREPMSQVKFGEFSDLSIERIRRIENRARDQLLVSMHGNLRLLPFGAVRQQCNSIQRSLHDSQVQVVELVQILRAYQMDPVSWQATALDQVLRMDVDQFEFSVRVQNCLFAAGIKYVWQLVTKTEDYFLLECKNFGRKSLFELENALRQLKPSLTLGMTLPRGFDPLS